MDANLQVLLAAIEQSPDDDGPRLAYADALDYDAYNPRAGLIRLGVAIAKHEPCPDCEEKQKSHVGAGKAICIEKACLMIQHSELIRQDESEFRRGPKCESCSGGKSNFHPEKCSFCHGTGDAGGLMRRNNVYHRDDGTYEQTEWLHTVEFHRGFPRVHCRMEECVRVCSRCDGDGKAHGADRQFEWSDDVDYGKCVVCKGNPISPSDWLLSVVRHHRGVEVWTTDRKPYKSTISNQYIWFAEDINGLQLDSEIYGFLFDKLPGDSVPLSRPNRSHKEFSTEEIAQVELARAIPAWAREYIR